jgi:hypothetical protein
MKARHQQNQTILHQLLVLEDDATIAPLYIPHHLMSDAKSWLVHPIPPMELMLFSTNLQSSSRTGFTHSTNLLACLQACSNNVKSDFTNSHICCIQPLCDSWNWCFSQSNRLTV